LNSGVNERRGRGFFLSMVSILDILSGAVPLMLDVRQTGGSPLLVTGDKKSSRSDVHSGSV